MNTGLDPGPALCPMRSAGCCLCSHVISPVLALPLPSLHSGSALALLLFLPTCGRAVAWPSLSKDPELVRKPASPASLSPRNCSGGQGDSGGEGCSSGGLGRRGRSPIAGPHGTDPGQTPCPRMRVCPTLYRRATPTSKNDPVLPRNEDWFLREQESFM